MHSAGRQLAPIPQLQAHWPACHNCGDCPLLAHWLQEYKRCFDRPDVGMGGAMPTMEVLSQVGGLQ